MKIKLVFGNNGFTMVEILIVIVILSILAGAAYLMLNPIEIFQDSRDSRRAGEIRQVRDALNRYFAAGYTLEDIEAQYGTIGDCDGTPSHIGTGTGNINLKELLVDDYTNDIPVDPNSSCNEQDTCYTMCIMSNGGLKIEAPMSENSSVEVK